MSAYNAQTYIAEAIESVLNQTFTDFEFIIINDGSTDETEKIITRYNDNRIRYFSQENTGVSKALNIGLNMAEGKYIAKLDADDVCYPTRFQEQYDFMENNPDYVVCGSYADVIDDNGNYIYTFNKIASLNDDIQKEMIYKNSIIHSSSFYLRTAALSVGGYYEPIRQYFEDYMFFSKLITIGKAFNFKKALIKYRVTPGSISIRTKNRKYNKLVHNVILRGYITEDEKVFLFSYRKKKAKKNVQLSNHYLALSKLYLLHKGDIKSTKNYYLKALKINPFNLNIFITTLYLLLLMIQKVGYFLKSALIG